MAADLMSGTGLLLETATEAILGTEAAASAIGIVGASAVGLLAVASLWGWASLLRLIGGDRDALAPNLHPCTNCGRRDARAIHVCLCGLQCREAPPSAENLLYSRCPDCKNLLWRFMAVRIRKPRSCPHCGEALPFKTSVPIRVLELDLAPSPDDGLVVGRIAATPVASGSGKDVTVYTRRMSAAILRQPEALVAEPFLSRPDALVVLGHDGFDTSDLGPLLDRLCRGPGHPDVRALPVVLISPDPAGKLASALRSQFDNLIEISAAPPPGPQISLEVFDGILAQLGVITSRLGKAPCEAGIRDRRREARRVVRARRARAARVAALAATGLAAGGVASFHALNWADCAAIEAFGGPALHWAAARGRIDLVERLVAKVPVDVVVDGTSALTVAVASESYCTARRLVELGADRAFRRHKDGRGPTVLATELQSRVLLDTVLGNRIAGPIDRLNPRRLADRDLVGPVRVAATGRWNWGLKRLLGVEHLREALANASNPRDLGAPLVIACVDARDKECLDSMLGAGGPVDAVNGSKIPAIILAASSRGPSQGATFEPAQSSSGPWFDGIETLARYGADLDASGPDGWSALDLAVLSEDTALFSRLASLGARRIQWERVVAAEGSLLEKVATWFGRLDTGPRRVAIMSALLPDILRRDTARLTGSRDAQLLDELLVSWVNLTEAVRETLVLDFLPRTPASYGAHLAAETVARTRDPALQRWYVGRLARARDRMVSSGADEWDVEWRERQIRQSLKEAGLGKLVHLFTRARPAEKGALAARPAVSDSTVAVRPQASAAEDRTVALEPDSRWAPRPVRPPQAAVPARVAVAPQADTLDSGESSPVSLPEPDRRSAVRFDVVSLGYATEAEALDCNRQLARKRMGGEVRLVAERYRVFVGTTASEGEARTLARDAARAGCSGSTYIRSEL